MSNKKGIKNNKKPKKNLVRPKTPLRKDELIISMSYKNWIKGYRGKDITTFTEDEKEFTRNLTYIIYELIPYVYENWSKNMQHCHYISELGGTRSKEAQENKLKATKRDYDKELDKLAEMYKAEDKEEFKKSMSEGSLEFLDRGILNSKAIDDIKKKVKYI